MRAAIVTTVVVYFTNSMAQSVQFLYVTYFINGIMMSLVTTLPLTFLINNWFVDKVGVALGLTSMGSGLGGAVFNAIAGQLRANAGWRATSRILALFVLVLAVPCIFFILKLRPEEMGLEPYRDGDAPVGSDGGSSASDSTAIAADDAGLFEGYTFAEARKLPLFWIICIAAVMVGIGMNGIGTAVPAHLQERGYSLTFSANYVSINMLAIAIAKILLGNIFDRFGARIGFSLACGSLVIAGIGLLFCEFIPVLALVSAGIGLGSIFGAVVFPLTIPSVFGKKDYRSIMGPLAALISFGGVIGPVASGRVFDMTGSYDMFFIACIGMMAVTTAAMLLLLPSKEKQF